MISGIPTMTMNAPTVEIMFNAAQPGKSGYVKTLRGIPMIPRKCCTMNVMLNPMTISQNCARPIFSDNIRPLIFGNQ